MSLSLISQMWSRPRWYNIFTNSSLSWEGSMDHSISQKNPKYNNLKLICWRNVCIHKSGHKHPHCGHLLLSRLLSKIFLAFLLSWHVPAITILSKIFNSYFFCIYPQARASDDYQPNDPVQWRIGISSMFTYAVGLTPFKDTFWTTTYQPHNYYHGNYCNSVLIMTGTGGEW